MKELMHISYEATQTRESFGEDANSPINIFSLLENQDEYTVIFYPMSEGLSGMCIKEKNNKIICINSALSKGRQRFTAAHELYHLKYHGDECYVCHKEFTDKKRDEEKEADIFASYFLAPYNSFRKYVEALLNTKESLNIYDIVKIEQYFQLSRMAALVRLKQEQYLNDIEFEQFKAYSAKSYAIQMGYSTDLYLPSPDNQRYFTIGKYIRLAEKAKEKEKISNSKYEEFLLAAFRDDIVYGTDGEDIID